MPRFACENERISKLNSGGSRIFQRGAPTQNIWPIFAKNWMKIKTRMHSSRMRTARSLTVSRSTCQGVYLPGGTCSGECTCPGVYLPGRLPAWGVCTCPGVYLPWGYLLVGCTCPGVGICPGAPPPCTEFLTHATENITLPQTSFAGGKNWTETQMGRSTKISKILLRCWGHSVLGSFLLIQGQVLWI